MDFEVSEKYFTNISVKFANRIWCERRPHLSTLIVIIYHKSHCVTVKTMIVNPTILPQYMDDIELFCQKYRDI